MSRPFPILAAFVVALAACSRPAARASPEFAAARDRHIGLVAQWADDAYDRPEMDEVVALLQRVPRESADADLAATLAARVAEGRRQAEERRASRDRIVAAAGPATWSPPTAAPERPSTADPPGSALPAAGARLEQLEADHGGCLQRKMPVRIEAPDGGAREGEAWGLRSDPSCEAAHPEEVGKPLLVVAGTLVDVRPASEARTVETRTNVRVPMLRLPDGGVVEVSDVGPGAETAGARMAP